MAVIDFQKWKEKKEENALYEKAVDLAESLGEISISALQREFKLGYNRAAAIVQRMEEEGVIEPSKAS